MRNPGIKQLLVICSLILPFACTKKTGSPTQENQSEKQSTETAAAPAGPQKITQNAYSPSNPFSVSRDQEGRISQITFPYGQVVTYQYKDQERFPNQKIIKGLFVMLQTLPAKPKQHLHPTTLVFIFPFWMI